MTAVLGIDLSSFAIDLVKLDEESNRADWTRCPLAGGAVAWERTLTIPEAMPTASFFDDVYLVAIEAPYGSAQPGTSAILNRVVGAIVACLPSVLRVPERCWIVRPDEWKGGLGFRGKPTFLDLGRLAPDGDGRRYGLGKSSGFATDEAAWQNARDAYALAFWARQENARGVPALAGGEGGG